MKENCIVALGIGLNYKFGLDRIKDCINKYNINADYKCFTEYPEGCEKHEDYPYAFKFYIIKYCFNLGYKNVLYIDASIYPKNNLNKFWQLLSKNGYFLVNNYHSVGQYTHDKFLQKINITRERSFTIKSIQSGFIGLNINSVNAMVWLNQMIEYSKDNISFVGCYDNNNNLCSKNKNVLGHRQDQSVGTILAIRCGLDKRFDEKVYFNIDRDSVKKNLNNEKRDFWWTKVDMSL
jgi:hypothetical protein